MNMPPPVSSTALVKCRDRIASATECVANQSMAEAAREVSSLVKDNDTIVSCDGTWQRRGFQSKNGVATVLSAGTDVPIKVVDVHVSSNHCDTCAKARKRFQG